MESQDAHDETVQVKRKRNTLWEFLPKLYLSIRINPCQLNTLYRD
ncbi:hypothetical protein BN185_2650001 [Clostridioides difficile E28]|nr:hypothetical protein BN167_2370002 [Clostridioides difficile E13]CCL20195.1 hypothetical protein BN171_3780001 [Clostridioides difficile E25]CCL24193.1 hypothetical protein BN172_5370001 [Clostridioides difficile T15]CCL28109.1 hypothetical protein BN173_3630001 [Clostridioides difficile T11]CCL32073.1 hypothetical protein BN174_3320001 [Clostridioides difficile E15]CCL51301.1 hypothetical protein BN179_3160006 [Clostridioides difficile T6]CCL55267.1 hypothetical protein BN180_2770002 [Clo